MKTIYLKPKDTTPYFYIIKHIPTGLLYAGSRWAASCHPKSWIYLDNGFAVKTKQKVYNYGGTKIEDKFYDNEYHNQSTSHVSVF